MPLVAAREASCQAFPEVRPGSGSHQWRRGDQRTSPESVANSSHNMRYVNLMLGGYVEARLI